MAKKKSEEDTVNSVYENLKHTHATAMSNRKFIQDACSNPIMQKILRNFENGVDSAKEELITAPKADVEKMQARIIASRQLLATLKGAYEADLEESGRALREYESKNSLLIHSQKSKEVADLVTGEIKQA